MLSWVKFGGITIGAGVVLGLGVVGWMKANPGEGPLANSGGWSVVLGFQRGDDTEETPAPSSSPAANVPLGTPDVGNNANSQSQSISLSGNASGNGGSSSGGSAGNGGGGSSAPAANVPGPEEFGQYEAYKDKEVAMYGDLVAGTGAAVANGSTVTVQYKGWLTSGKLFDQSTADRPYSFVEGAHGVIPGWEEGLFGMKVGGKRRLIIPPGRGYGAAGAANGLIPPNSVLVFDVELVAVK